MRIGIDLGGTKTEIICLDNDGVECYRQRVASPQGDYYATVQNIVGLISQAEAALNVTTTVGVGIPGTLDSCGQVINSNSVWINGQWLQRDLEQSLQRSVTIANDANCFTLSEAVDGAGSHHASVFGVIIGTGCGGGLAINQKIITGVQGIAGEWGHNPLPFPRVLADMTESIAYFDTASKKICSDIYQHKPSPQYVTDTLEHCEYPGPACYCGKRGCLETWLSGPGFSDDFFRVTGIRETPDKIMQRVDINEFTAVKTFDRYCERLAKSLAQIINIIDPDVIVLGGGMSNIDQLYEEVPARWQRYIFSTKTVTLLKPAVHGDASGVRGAAFL